MAKQAQKLNPFYLSFLALRSLILMVLLGIVTVFISTTAILIRFFPYSIRYRYIMAFCPIALFLARTICGIRYEITGLENLQPTINSKAPAVIISNHQSTWETFLFPAIFPPQAVIIKRSLLKIPFWGWSFASLNPIAIDRDAGRKAMLQVLKQGKKAVEQGKWLIIFPEGTRADAGKLLSFKRGSGALAAFIKQPVTPIAHNAGHCWPKKGFIKRPGTIQVHIGPAIDSNGKNADQINTEAREWIAKQLAFEDE